MKQFFVRMIEWYQKFLSPDQGVPSVFKTNTANNCSFYPTCSEYTKEAVLKYGAPKGLWLGFRRILRCHPWQKNHIDPLI